MLRYHIRFNILALDCTWQHPAAEASAEKQTSSAALKGTNFWGKNETSRFMNSSALLWFTAVDDGIPTGSWCYHAKLTKNHNDSEHTSQNPSFVNMF